MQEDVILKVISRLKEIRKERGRTMQEVADRAGVSKGLISQIENNRTVPSLIVFIDIIKALDLDMNQFFKDLSQDSAKSIVVVKRKSEYESFHKEDVLGVLCQRIFTKSVDNAIVDIVLLELEPGAVKPMVSNDAFHCKYIVSGSLKYVFQDQEIVLSSGDSLLFDGRFSHTAKNTGEDKAIILIVYLFESNRGLI